MGKSKGELIKCYSSYKRAFMTFGAESRGRLCECSAPTIHSDAAAVHVVPLLTAQLAV